MNATAQELIRQAKAAIHIGNSSAAQAALDKLNRYAIIADNLVAGFDAIDVEVNALHPTSMAMQYAPVNGSREGAKLIPPVEFTLPPRPQAEKVEPSETNQDE